MALDHAVGCDCELCRAVRRHALPIEQIDCERLAQSWALWRGTEDREVAKLRDGETGSPGSPRWTALQAIAATRLALTKRPADVAVTSAEPPNPDAIAIPPATASPARPIGPLRSGQSTNLDDGA